jgi:hypothetical protein
MAAFDKFVQQQGKMPLTTPTGSFDAFAKSKLGIDTTVINQLQKNRQQQQTLANIQSMLMNRGLSPTISKLVAGQAAPAAPPSNLQKVLGTIKKIPSALVSQVAPDINLLGLGTANVIALSKIAAARATGNKPAEQAAKQQVKQFSQTLAQTGGIQGAGLPGGYTPTEFKKPLAPGKFVKTTAVEGAKLAPYFVGGGELAPALAELKAGGVPALKAAASYLASTGGATGIGTGAEAAVKPGATPKKVLEETLKGFLYGTGGALVAGGLGLGIGKIATTAEKDLTKLATGAKKVTPGITGAVPKAIQPEDSTQIVINALKEAKPLYKEQKQLYAQALAKKAGAASQIGKTVSGEKGYIQQLSALKGGLPKVQFESIRNQIKQPVIDDLFNKIEQSNLSTFEKINAKTGLAKLFGAEGGRLPTKSELGLLNEVMGNDFVKAAMTNRPLLQKFGTAGSEILNLPRSIMTTVDLSAPFRQGVFLISKPKQFAGAFKDMFKYAGSEKAYQGLIKDIRSRSTYKAMRESKLALTDISATLQGREEAFMSNLAEKIPIFGKVARASDRAYTGFLNKLRADTFDDLYKKANVLGITESRPQVAQDIAKFVNSASGRGDLGKLNRAAVALNSVFFSPRLMASRINMLNPVYYVKLDPFVRKEALKSLLTTASIGSTILALSKLGGADVGTDPRSSDFGKIKIGNTRYDPWGGFQQYIVLASRLATGEMISSTTGKEIKLGEGYKTATRKDILQRFLESKTAPVASFVNGILTGTNFQGDKFDVSKEIADRFIPMMTQDLYDLYKEHGAAGIPMAIPGVFGVGSQTYGQQVPMKGTTKTGKESIKFRSPPSLGETLINKLTGQQITNIPESQWATYRKQKELQTKYEDTLTQTKKQVLDSGKSKEIFNPVKNKRVLIYMKNGVVKTKYLK